MRNDDSSPTHRRLSVLAGARAPRRLVVCGDFDTGTIAQVIDAWASRLGDNTVTVRVPSGQVVQHLLDPSSAVNRTSDGLVAIVLGAADLAKTGSRLGKAGRDAEPGGEVGVFVSAVLASRERSHLPMLIAVCPSVGNRAQDHRGIVDQLRSAVGDQVYVLDTTTLITRYAVGAWHDQYADRIAGVPYTEDFLIALGTGVYRAARAMTIPRPKALVVDCDQTLWDGTLAEDGVAGVGIGPQRQAIQRFLLEQRDAGRLVCLSSKNDVLDVEAVFRRPEMLLRMEHISVRRINWTPKSLNLADIADELGFGLESITFLDDNPVECAAVRAAHPQVCVIELPTDAGAAVQTLHHAWGLDVVRTTEEDRSRAGYYAEEARRRTVRNTAPTLAEYVAGLELGVGIEPATSAQADRLAQLTRRITQFVTVRRPLEEHEMVEEMGRGGVQVLAVTASDRFGSYGLVGILILSPGPDAVRLETLMLSCRALGRGIEFAVTAHVARYAVRRGLEWVDLDFRPAPRNQPAHDFIRLVAGCLYRRFDPAHGVRVPAAGLADLSFADGLNGGPAGGEPRPTAPVPGSRPTSGPSMSSVTVELLRTVEQIRAAVWSGLGARTGPDGEAATDVVTQVVLRLWAEVVGTGAPVDTYDELRECGGTSLHLAQLMVRIHDTLGVELPVDLLAASSCTPRVICAAIAAERSRVDTEAVGAVCFRPTLRSPSIATRVRCVVIDLPRLGESRQLLVGLEHDQCLARIDVLADLARGGQPPTMAELARAYAQLLDTSGCRPAVVVGDCSAGALGVAIAGELAMGEEPLPTVLVDPRWPSQRQVRTTFADLRRTLAGDVVRDLHDVGSELGLPEMLAVLRVDLRRALSDASPARLPPAAIIEQIMGRYRSWLQFLITCAASPIPRRPSQLVVVSADPVRHPMPPDWAEPDRIVTLSPTGSSTARSDVVERVVRELLAATG